MAEATYVGTRPRGRRMHLTNERGWSVCSRTCAEVTPIEHVSIQVDDPWCAACLAKMVMVAVEVAHRDFARHQRGERLFESRTYPPPAGSEDVGRAA